MPPWLSTVTYLTSEGAPTLLLPVHADACGRAHLITAHYFEGGEEFITSSKDDSSKDESSRSSSRSSSSSSAHLSYPLARKHLAFDGR